MKKLKTIPQFKTEEKERIFWLKHDSTDYVDWSKAKHTVFSNLKSTSRIISVRIPEHLLVKIKQIANKRDVPYQSLMKIFLIERVQKELHIV